MSNGYRHSVHFANHTSLPAPLPPQHTNIRHSYVETSTHFENRRNSITNLTPQDGTVSNVTIDFENGSHVIIRPNRIVRGKVTLTAIERLYASRIRIKFRAEEIALVKVDDGNESKSERLHQNTTIFFQTEWKLWGDNATAYSQASWDEMKPGKYEFPFALKFPNVNYPPSMEEPKGFGIRYVWTAQVDGPALQSGLKSTEYVTPYRPIILSTPDREWQLSKVLMRDNKTFACKVVANMLKQCYCPDEPFLMHLRISAQPDSKITHISFQFRKHHQGKILVQKGTAFREYTRIVLEGTIPVTGIDHEIQKDISFNVPTKLVSPSFISHHTRVHYDLHFRITTEYGLFFRSTHTSEFSIPFNIANLPYNQLLRVPDITSIQFYKNSKDCPQFFDPVLDDLPSDDFIQPMPLTSTPRDDPPNYFCIPNLPKSKKERKEESVYLTRLVKYGQIELAHATITSDLFDEDW